MTLHSSYQLTKKIVHDVYPAIAPKRPDLCLDGKTALISGGGSGIGLATAKTYAQAGVSQIVITGRRRDRLEAAARNIQALSANVRVVPIVADVTDGKSIQALWTEVADRIGKIDILVNNAGKGAEAVMIGDGEVESWWSVQQTNLYSVYTMTDAYLDSLADSEEQGTVINVVSAAALSEQAGSSAYSVSKFAIIKLTQFVHAESPHIRAFSVHPGIVPTEMSGDLVSDDLDTEELAGAFNLYLASSRAEFLRGRFVAANWDVEELECHQKEISTGKLLQFGIYAGLGQDGHKWQDTERD